MGPPRGSPHLRLLGFFLACLVFSSLIDVQSASDSGSRAQVGLGIPPHSARQPGNPVEGTHAADEALETTATPSMEKSSEAPNASAGESPVAETDISDLSDDSLVPRGGEQPSALDEPSETGPESAGKASSPSAATGATGGAGTTSTAGPAPVIYREMLRDQYGHDMGDFIYEAPAVSPEEYQAECGAPRRQADSGGGCARPKPPHPADAVFTFAQNHVMSLENQIALVKRICETGSSVHAWCQGDSRAIVLHFPVTAESGDRLGEVRVRLHEEAADVAYQFKMGRRNLDDGEIGGKAPEDLPASFVDKIREAICARGGSLVSCTREKAVVFTTTITHQAAQDGAAAAGPAAAGDLSILQTARQMETQAEDQLATDAALASLEGQSIVQLEGQELADIVYDLVVQTNALPATAYRVLTDRLCSLATPRVTLSARQVNGTEASIATDATAAVPAPRPAWEMPVCGRTRIVVDRVPVSDESGPVGNLEILEGQEVVDSLYTFRQTHSVTAHFVNQLFQHVCSTHGDKCSRNRALVVDDVIRHPDGAMPVPEPLQIWDGDEPADSVQAWAERNGLPKWFRDDVIKAVCSGHFSLAPSQGLRPVQCRRESPILLQMPLSDENGKSLGYFTMLENEEAADAAFAFASRNGLSATFRQALMANLCGRDHVQCNRERARAFSGPLQMPLSTESYPWPLEIWEDEEPADSLYLFAYNVSKHNVRARELQANGTIPDDPLWLEEVPELDIATRQALLFSLCGNHAVGLTCSRPIPAQVSMPVTDEKGEVKGMLHVLEGERPIDALLYFMNENKLSQSVRHPNLRRRLFGRLCGLAADKGLPLNCSITTPRQRVASLELTYAGIASKLGYYLPDEHTLCEPLPPAAAHPNRTKSSVTAAKTKEEDWDGMDRLWEPLTDDDMDRAVRFSAGWMTGTEEDMGCLSPTRVAVRHFCARLSPMPRNCLTDIHTALLDHLEKEDKSRFEKEGPVGINYYKMLRCPNDAPTVDVKERIQVVGREVRSLAQDVHQRLEKVVSYENEGLASFVEANYSVLAANASLRAARALLQAANQSLASARTGIESARQMGNATDAALEAAFEVTEGLRERLLLLCNETIVRRNCSRDWTFHPLPGAGPGNAREQSETATFSRKELADMMLDPNVQAFLRQQAAKEEGGQDKEEGKQVKRGQESRPGFGAARGSRRAWDRSGREDPFERIRREERERLERLRGKLGRRDTSSPRAGAVPHRQAEGQREDEEASNVTTQKPFNHFRSLDKPPSNITIDAWQTGPATFVPDMGWSDITRPGYLNVTLKSGRQVQARPTWRVCLSDQEPGSDSKNRSAVNAEVYADAIEGCEKLYLNKMWVCSEAAGRLPALLPRFPIEKSLSTVNHMLEAWTAAVNQTRLSINAARSALDSLSASLASAQSSKSIATVASKVAKLNLNAANASGLEVKDDMERVHHRSWALDRARDELTVGKNREFYDKPCRPVFGACCARDQADGGLSITCG